MKKTKIIIGIVAILVAISAGFLLRSKMISNVPFESPAVISSTSTLPFSLKVKSATAKQLISSENLELKPLQVSPIIPPYSLPLDISKIQNTQRVSEHLNLSGELLDKLKNNGFVVTKMEDLFKGQIYSDENFEYFYSQLQSFGICRDFICSEGQEKEGLPVPIFITTDSVLHYYHLVFSSTLLRLERSIFFDSLWQMDKDLLESSMNLYKQTNDPLIKEAARRNMAYFSVALKLLQPKDEQILTAQRLKEKGDNYSYDSIKIMCGSSLTNTKCIRDYIETNFPNEFSKNSLEKYQFIIPEEVKKEVNEEINLIETHKEWEFSPIFIYKEDYSQYVPRGHYTKGEKLKNYFKAMMWHGRMTMLINGSKDLKDRGSICMEDGIVSKENAQIQTLQASLISQEFRKKKDIQDKWRKMYAITSFLVGYSDDLGPYEYIEVLDKVFTDNNIDSSKIDLLQKELFAIPFNPQIYSGLGECQLYPPYDSEQALNYLKQTKGFRFMGQRYTLDSDIFFRLVSPFTGVYKSPADNLAFTTVITETGRLVRGFPRGLDIMALLDSSRAKYWLHQFGDDNYTEYSSSFSELEQQINDFTPSDWFKNVYQSWLYTLQPLLEKFTEGYPTFMQTNAYQDKSLNTALSSWAQLRHDTILYPKQSYTMGEGGGGPGHAPARGYVEPIPEFYNRLLALTKMTGKGLKNLLTSEEQEQIIPSSYSALSNEKQDIFNQLSLVIEKLLEISKKELENKELNEDEYQFIDYFGDVSSNLIETLLKSNEVGNIVGMDEILKSTVVADVHTDGNTLQVLEEGVGKIKAMVVAYQLPDKRILIGVGPVFSYYEFKQPMDNRLTDEAWRLMLKNNPPPEPEWVKSFSL